MITTVLFLKELSKNEDVFRMRVRASPASIGVLRMIKDADKEEAVVRVLVLLNRMLIIDNEATSELFATMINFNHEFAENERIPVVVRDIPSGCQASLTGVLNGLLMEALQLDHIPIARMMSDRGKILAFVRYNPKNEG
jgi:hypothetical protein